MNIIIRGLKSLYYITRGFLSGTAPVAGSAQRIPTRGWMLPGGLGHMIASLGWGTPSTLVQNIPTFGWSQPGGTLHHIATHGWVLGTAAPATAQPYRSIIPPGLGTGTGTNMPRYV